MRGERGGEKRELRGGEEEERGGEGRGGEERRRVLVARSLGLCVQAHLSAD